MEPPRILLVEDNDELAQELQANLSQEGYDVHWEKDGPAGLRRAAEDPWELIILDLRLPGTGNLDLLRKLRGKDGAVPVLILTGPGTETERVLALRMGADDCLDRPVATLELLAHVEALLRRRRWARETISAGTGPETMPLVTLPDYAGNGAEATGEPALLTAGSPHPDDPSRPTLRFGEVQVDPGSRQVLRDGEPVSLTPREFELLMALVRRNGDVVTRADLLQEVWKGSVPPESRTLDTHMAELRRKLECDASDPDHLLTVRKVGYRFQR